MNNEDMLIDTCLPVYDVSETNKLLVRGSIDEVGRAVESLDLSSSWIVRVLFFLRGLPRDAVRLEGFKRMGFQVLAHRPDEEIVLGLIGKFWKWRGDLRRFAGEDFAEFSEPGYGKVAWNYRIIPLERDRIRVETQTRVACTDADSRRKFLRYWRLIRPFSGLIRKESLRCIRREVEARSQEKASDRT